MKNKTSILLISMLVFGGLMVLVNNPVQAQEDNVIVIGVVDGQLKFNRTSINVSPGVTYTIIFQNIDTFQGHNFRIDVDGDLSSSTTNDADDIVIGLNNTAAATSAAYGVQQWEGTWTAPDSNGEVSYYCGVAGHYDSGMEGVFVVGEGEAPGFGLFAGLAAILFIGLAVPRLRRR